MVITLVGIIGFQGWWLKNNYNREKNALEISANVKFQEDVRGLQAMKLKLVDPNFTDSPRHGKMKVFISDNLPGGHPNVNYGPNPEIVTVMNSVQSKLKDSLKKNVKVGGAMIISMDDMLWSIDPVNDTMDKTIERMREFASALQNRHNLVIELQAADEVFLLKPDMKTRYEFMSIFKTMLRIMSEQLHSEKINVELSYEKSVLQLSLLCDATNLPGNNSALNKLIAEINSRANAINGSFEIQHQEGGTTMTFRVRI